MTQETLQPSQRAAIPIPFDENTVQTIADYAILAARIEQGPPCENCGKPILVGQVVLPWDDPGELHVDCDHPFSLKVERHDGEPEPVILLGEPMRYFSLAAILSEHDSRVEKLEAENARLRELTESAMRPIEAWGDYAHKDDLVLLLVEFEDHSTADATFALTIGGNNDHNVDEGEGVGWQFAGWCWTHDHWVEGVGKPVGFMPLPHHLARDMEASAILNGGSDAAE